jgi:hypothetical protein
MSSSTLRRSTRQTKPTENDIQSAQPIRTDAPPSASSLNTALTIKGSNILPSSTINSRARFMPTRGLAAQRVLLNPETKSPSTDSPDTDQAKKGKKPKLSSAITTGEIELGASNASVKKKRTVGTKKRKVGYKKGTKVVKAKKTSTDNDEDGEDYKDDSYEPSETDNLLELMDGDDDDVNVDDDKVGDRLKGENRSKVDAVKVGDRYVRMLFILI